MIPKLKDILPTYILEDAGRPDIHKSGQVWAHKGSEGKYGAEYKSKIEYFHDKNRARAFAKTGSGYSGISNTGNISDKDTEKVTNIRDYTDDEYDEETEEYFENDDTMKAAPNAFIDKDDMIRQMKTAKPKFLSLNNMRNMNNSDVGDILKAGDKKSMYNKGKELATQEYGKDWDSIQKGMNNPKAKFPSPIALRDKKGSLWLIAGNTRLMAFTAIGKKLPMKIIDYGGEFKT